MMSARDVLGQFAEVLGVERFYDWQLVAFDRLVEGDIPGQIKVPTAAGKTMILPLFVAALAAQARLGQVSLPRRIVHVVNRRILVDESTRLARVIEAALTQDPRLAEAAAALSALSATGAPLRVSTLRGGVDDDGAWSVDPSTPAMILATPDMLGSRLLFRGYGVGRSRGATHAGLLGCDCLVVHDEAHLAPAFTALLRQVESMAAPGARLISRPRLTVTEMTATLASEQTTSPLVCDLRADAALSRRMAAKKRLRLADARQAGSKAQKPAEMVLESLAGAAIELKDRRSAVCLFVSFPGAAEKLANRLTKGGIDASRVIVLTGTMRGYERAALREAEAFRQFDPGAGRVSGQTAYFIATAAGEIGLDIDADVGLFDLTTLDRFIQRAGRVNRRGLTVGEIVLIHAGGDELPEPLQERGRKTLPMLEALGKIDGELDASPLALSDLCDAPGYAEAVEPPPAIRPLEPAIIDMLAMTSLRLDEILCPSPDVFIRGLVEEDAELKLAWRWLPMQGSDYASWLEAWPLLPLETAPLPFERAKLLLREVLLRAKTQCAGPLALALDSQGLPASGQAVLMPGMRVEPWIRSLRPGNVVLLAPDVGGLSLNGLPSHEAEVPVRDVSSGFTDADGLERVEVKRVAVEVVPGEDGLSWKSGDASWTCLSDLVDAVAGSLEPAFHDSPPIRAGEGWSGIVSVWLTRPAPRSPDAGDAASLSGRDRLLEEHLDLAARAASRLAQRLGLPRPLDHALVRAAAEHDRGKAWTRWQRAIRNADLSKPLGKTATSVFDFKLNDGYRHELGSIVDRGAELSCLERHLVASHHGWSRPVFRESARNKPGCHEASLNCMRDFAALGGELGPWALCYLEAVLKGADILSELIDSSLAADPVVSARSTSTKATDPALMHEPFRLQVELANFGEYLAALGLSALLVQCGFRPRIGWDASTFLIAEVPAEGIRSSLESLARATAILDLGSTVKEQQDGAYPPLMLQFDAVLIRLNHWLDERLTSGSRWKLGAGQTKAFGTMTSVLAACRASLDLPDFEPSSIFSIGGGRVGADASKFRFDTATSWSARDSGFSLNESDALKSTRPWVELLSTLGLQYFFPPPADRDPAYFTWGEMLPMSLALAAAKGLLPQSIGGLRPVIESSGKMKDVFSSQPLLGERSPACPPRVLVI